MILFDIEDTTEWIVLRMQLHNHINNHHRLWQIIEKFQILLSNRNLQIEELETKIKEQSNIIGQLCKLFDNNKETNYEKYKCIACCNNIRSVIFLPCFHTVYCEECAKKDQNKNCPICRKKISDTKNILY